MKRDFLICDRVENNVRGSGNSSFIIADPSNPLSLCLLCGQFHLEDFPSRSKVVQLLRTNWISMWKIFLSWEIRKKVLWKLLGLQFFIASLIVLHSELRLYDDRTVVRGSVEKLKYFRCSIKCIRQDKRQRRSSLCWVFAARATFNQLQLTSYSN